MENNEIKNGSEIERNELQNLKNNNNISNINNKNASEYSWKQKFFAEFIGGIFLLFIGSGVGVYTQGDLVS